jgi:hypothetical protein
MLLVDETVASGIDCDACCSGDTHDFLPLHFARRKNDRCLLATFIRAELDRPRAPVDGNHPYPNDAEWSPAHRGPLHGLHLMLITSISRRNLIDCCAPSIPVSRKLAFRHRRDAKKRSPRTAASGSTVLSWRSVRLRLARLPKGVSWAHLAKGAWLAGIGFTISLLRKLSFTKHGW